MAIQVHGNNSAAYYKALFKKELAALYPENELDSIFRLMLCDVFHYPYSSTNRIDGILFSESEILKLHKILGQLKENVPIQHIIGFTEFCGLKIAVNMHTLIPRPETEYLIHLVKQQTKTNISSVLDVCSGSGCIALALKNVYKAANVIAYELSDEAIVLSKKNAENNQLKVEFKKLDVLNDLWPDNKIDLIVSNPPYIPTKEKSQIDNSVLSFEPHLALFVDNEKPLIFYDVILNKAASILSQNGAIFFEINPNYAHDLLSLANNLGYSATLHKDLDDRDRFIHCKWIRA